MERLQPSSDNSNHSERPFRAWLIETLPAPGSRGRHAPPRSHRATGENTPHRAALPPCACSRRGQGGLPGGTQRRWATSSSKPRAFSSPSTRRSFWETSSRGWGRKTPPLRLLQPPVPLPQRLLDRRVLPPQPRRLPLLRCRLRVEHPLARLGRVAVAAPASSPVSTGASTVAASAPQDLTPAPPILPPRPPLLAHPSRTGPPARRTRASAATPPATPTSSATVSSRDSWRAAALTGPASPQCLPGPSALRSALRALVLRSTPFTQAQPGVLAPSPRGACPPFERRGAPLPGGEGLWVPVRLPTSQVPVTRCARVSPAPCPLSRGVRWLTAGSRSRTGTLPAPPATP
ncbi:Basic proline-rich protein precursor [Archangium gephyra]|uniref:Basic proline-rich protein n=1 Tax=Archangium gephyra TaxID=48 RepID=A0AAC8Q0K2_9BACT|nr:Basic proline-rich protein precursor [Archangium gephyra]